MTIPKRNAIADFAARASFVLAVGAVLFGIPGFGKPFKLDDHIKVAQAWVLAAVIILPPVAFWFDYYFLFGKLSKADQKEIDFDRYKYGIDVCSKCWIALVTGLLGLYFGKDLVH